MTRTTSFDRPAGPVRRSARVLAFIAVALVCAGLALLAVRVGGYPFGTARPDDESCIAPGALPAGVVLADGPSVPATATRTWLPLGLVCDVTLGGPGARTIVVVHQNWPATVAWSAATLLGAVAALAACRDVARWVSSSARRRALPS